jgi:4-amino-4-deoxy-L-arabinose transferase-like glycosyltransferase
LEPKVIAFMVQPVIGAVDCLLIYVLCKKLCRPRAGLVAAGICAVHPSLINSSSQVLSEDWAIFFLLLGLITALSHRKRSLFAAGLFIGGACAVRSPCLAMLLGLVAWLMWTDRERGARRALALLAGALIPISLVSVHLSVASQSPVFVTLQNVEANTVKPVWGGFETLELEHQFRRGSYFEFAWRHPVDFAKERMISFITFASPWPFGDDRSLRRKGVMVLSDGLVLVTSIVAAVSLWRRNPRSPWFVLVWLPCCLCVFYTLFFSSPRYRVPTLPLLVAFSTMVLLPQTAHSRMYTQWRSRLARPVAAKQDH